MTLFVKFMMTSSLVASKQFELRYRKLLRTVQQNLRSRGARRRWSSNSHAASIFSAAYTYAEVRLACVAHIFQKLSDYK